jgi:hypothetical protein
MPQKKRSYSGAHTYKRRSQVYSRLRSKKLASGHYVVQHMVTKRDYYVFKRLDKGDWVVADAKRNVMRSGFRTKDLAMEALEAGRN